MDDIYAARVMTSDVRTVTPDELVEDAATTMLEEDIGSVVVVDEEDHLQGILTSTDFVQIVAERKPKDQTPVSEYMSTDVVTTDPQEPIRDVADTLVEHGVHHLPVVTEEEMVVGIVSTADLTSYLSHVQTPSPTRPEP